jgi:hypothetical protein
MIDINEALTAYLGTDERGGYMTHGQEERLRKHYGEAWQQAMKAIDNYSSLIMNQTGRSTI